MWSFSQRSDSSNRDQASLSFIHAGAETDRMNLGLCSALFSVALRHKGPQSVSAQQGMQSSFRFPRSLQSPRSCRSAAASGRACGVKLEKTERVATGKGAARMAAALP